MAGATTAAPVSALSALQWNPATISGMQRSELEVGLDLLWSEHMIASSFSPFSGETAGQSGVVPLPNFAWVQRTRYQDVTFGLNVGSVAGFKTNVPGDVSNPVLAPQPAGLGSISSEAMFLQIAPVLSYSLTDRWSVAAGPTLTIGQLSVSPFVFNAANINGTYPSGHGSEYEFGGGFQIGSFYQSDYGFDFGASFKSQTWMQEFDYQSTDHNGLPRDLQARLNLPMIVSLGTAYHGFDRWVIATDVRYIDYAQADGFGDPAVLHADGRLEGLGWDSVFAISVGARRAIGERFVLASGYAFNQSPIDDAQSMANVASPLFYQHMFSIGGSYAINHSANLNVAYSHYFENDVQGPLLFPGAGAIPGSVVKNSISADVVSFGVSFQR